MNSSRKKRNGAVSGGKVWNLKKFCVLMGVLQSVYMLMGMTDRK